MKDVFDFKMFVDCGAPSLYNKLSRQDVSRNKITMGVKLRDRKFDDYSYTEKPEYAQYRDAYIQFLLDNKGKIDVYSNLDVINNPKLTYRNQKILEDAGLHPIPVYHLGCDSKWLEKYVRDYEYIALGGLVPNPTSVLIPWLDKIFKEHILDSDGFPKTKVHGFACTSFPLMTRYPWFSVDSATCRKIGNFGIIILPNYLRENPIKHFQVSSRTKKVNTEHSGFFSLEEAPVSNCLNDLSTQEVKAFELRCEKYGMNFQDLADNIIQRVIWNYLIFEEMLQKTVPNWPWSMYTRKSEEGANKYMTLYFAGILSKSEEQEFWKGVSRDNITKIKGALKSFFYKQNTEYVLSLKK